MQEVINMNNIVFFNNNKVLTSSRIVATQFGKEHKNVLRDIRKLIEDMGQVFNHETHSSDMSHDISKYFIESSYVSDRGREEVQYLLTKDGFTLLAMGFRGPKALTFKVDYIEAYNTMEQSLIKVKQEFLELEARLAARDKEILERSLSRTELALEEAEEKCYALENYYEELRQYNKEWVDYANSLENYIEANIEEVRR